MIRVLAILYFYTVYRPGTARFGTGSYLYAQDRGAG